MFVVKNAWKSVTRNKGRNMLIIVIVTIIAAAATIGLSIRQAAATARSSGLDNTTVTAQISLDRGNSFPNRASSPSRIPIRPMLPPNLTSTPCVPLWPTSSFRLPTIRSTRRLHPR